MNIEAKPALRKESMRIAGKLVSTDESVEVLNPYTGKVIGTVPAGRPEHVRAAFAQARAYRPKLTRFERQRILQTTAEILRNRKEEFARLITANPVYAGRIRFMKQAAPSTSGPSRRSSPSRMTARSIPATSARTARTARFSRRACRFSAPSRRSRRSTTRSTW